MIAGLSPKRSTPGQHPRAAPWAAVLDYGSPLRNLGETLHLEALEREACVRPPRVGLDRRRRERRVRLSRAALRRAGAAAGSVAAASGGGAEARLSGPACAPYRLLHALGVTPRRTTSCPTGTNAARSPRAPRARRCCRGAPGRGPGPTLFPPEPAAPRPPPGCRRVSSPGARGKTWGNGAAS